MKGIKSGNAYERFWRRVDKAGPNGCWLWLGPVQARGYGTITHERKQWYTHRFAWTMLRGPIPQGMQIDHKCHVRECVNPDHLQPVPPKLNCENFSNPNGRGVSGIRGVHPKRDGWIGCVKHNHREYRSSQFATRDEAAEWVRAKRLELHSNNLLDRAS